MTSYRLPIAPDLRAAVGSTALACTSEMAGSEPVLAAARRRSGVARPPSASVQAGLDALLSSLREEARLSAFGRIAGRRDLVGKLANLMILEERAAADPGIGERPVTAPVFITGLPRSGTSFLHALLSTVGSARAPRAWEVAFPAAEPGGGRLRFARQIALFNRLTPELASLHPLSADGPQECTEILAHTFRSLRFDTTHHVPGYRRWLDRNGHDDAYRFHRRFLQHLQGQARTRWVLKSPDHVAALPSLRLVYPDALLVVVHRDPRRVMASVARLTELLRRPFSREVDRASIGRQVVRDWAAGMRTIMELEGALHIRHQDLIADPVGTARLVCEWAGLAFDGADATRLDAHVRERPRGGYGENHYAPGDYGIDPETLKPLRRAYLRRFGVRSEADQTVAGTRGSVSRTISRPR